MTKYSTPFQFPPEKFSIYKATIGRSQVVIYQASNISVAYIRLHAIYRIHNLSQWCVICFEVFCFLLFCCKTPSDYNPKVNISLCSFNGCKVPKQRHSVVETWHLKVASKLELEVYNILPRYLFPHRSLSVANWRRNVQWRHPALLLQYNHPTVWRIQL